MKTIKRLFCKCAEAKKSEYQALLDWRNTPTEGMGTSPAQRFFGRRCRTLLPMTKTLLKPSYDTTPDARALLGKKAKQALYYNQQAHNLPPIAPGETVRMKLPGEKTWTPGTCTGEKGPRSYGVRVGETVYRRNRRHLLHRNEPPIPEGHLPETQTQRAATPTVEDKAASGNDEIDAGTPPREPVVQPTQPPAMEPLRRSTRERRQPD